MLFEFLRLILGTLAGVFAISSLIIAFRAHYFGRSAFYANQNAIPKSIRDNFTGIHGNDVHDNEGVRSLGIAMKIDSKELVPQYRLSPEAVKDVIGAKL